MTPLRRTLLAMLTAVPLLGQVACDPSPDGVPVPMSTQCHPVGTWYVELTLACPRGGGGADGICGFDLRTSDSSVLAIGTAYWGVVNDSSDTFRVNTIGVREGTATIDWQNEAGETGSLGTVRVDSGC